ncbi:hypothetical protein EXS56_01590 [Candidatus Kaiserbacteria bacterium]|nr:hypothetical protein [Candidatus Kaiserbacteria bacterium]
MKNVFPKLRALATRVETWYQSFFSIAEIRGNPTLQWAFGAMLFYFYVTFDSWIISSAVTVQNAGNAVCWPHFQNCGWLYFLNNLPSGYSQTTFYMALYTVMLLIIYCMWKKRWTAAHALMLILFVWKAFVGYFLSYGILGMYDDYHLILTAALLFIPHKEYFLKLLFVVLYFVSATIKFHPAWVLGTYFTSLQSGLPLFPDALMPLITGSVILEQVVGCWFLMSKNKVAQRLAFGYFLIFHLYSGVLVLYNYPSATLPALIILFGPMYRYQRPPLSWKAVGGWTLVGLMFVFQMPSWIPDADTLRITDGNNRYGMWMFDANHQCVTTVKYYYRPGIKLVKASSEVASGESCANFECVTKSETYEENGGWVKEIRLESPVSWKRCDPYEKWALQKNKCTGRVAHVSMQLDHSINGGPFYRIIDEQNICELQYHVFGQNTWIQAPPEAPAVGTPLKNVYRYQGQQ